MRACFSTLAAEDAFFLIHMKVPVFIKIKDFLRADAYTCTTVDAFILVPEYRILEHFNFGTAGDELFTDNL